jgi:hypothetical protein
MRKLLEYPYEEASGISLRKFLEYLYEEASEIFL